MTSPVGALICGLTLLVFLAVCGVLWALCRAADLGDQIAADAAALAELEAGEDLAASRGWKRAIE